MTVTGVGSGDGARLGAARGGAWRTAAGRRVALGAGLGGGAASVDDAGRGAMEIMAALGDAAGLG